MTVISRIIVLSLLLTAILTGVVSASVEQDYQDARKAYYALQDSSRKQMYRDQWERIMSKFQAVHDRYPNTKRGADALFMVAKTADGLYTVSRTKKDAEAAVRQYQKVAEVYPDNSLADDSLMRAGELLEHPLQRPDEAFLAYERLVNLLPDGDMVSKARKRLAALQNFAPPPPETPAEPDVAVVLEEPKQPERGSAQTANLQSIRFWSNPGYTRIVLDLSRETAFSAHFLDAESGSGTPPRLYVDLQTAGLADSLNEPQIVDDGLLQQIRTGKPTADTVRVVLDLKSIGNYKVFPLPDPYRVVIDIAAADVPELKRRDPELRVAPVPHDDAIGKVLDGQPKGEVDLHVPTAPASTTLRRIVVDAGHGGKDPGAVGYSGTLEKDITLALAKKLAKKLREHLDCEVILTRDSDVFLPLEERTAIANKVGADLFISIHANANNNRKAYGVETYYLNFSKNDKAAAVAARENGTTLKQVSDLELILFDLMANAKINESSMLAAEIQKNLVTKLSRHYRDIRDLGVRQGPFYVLLGATMPSVLVETAFISNPREEKRLKNSKYQDHAADAIALAVKRYAIANKLVVNR